MDLISSLINNINQKRQLRNDSCNRLIAEMNHGLRELNLLFSNKADFVEPEHIEKWKARYQGLQKDKQMQNVKVLKKAVSYQDFLKIRSKFYEELKDLDKKVSIHNQEAANRKVENAYQLIGSVEGRRLDKQQMSCIVKEVHNHLVIAGAGTGKTTTIVGKIKYLLKANICNPEEILVLSFTHASAVEMKERIENETGMQIEASTFHKLGKNIITKVEAAVPKTTRVNLRQFVKTQIKKNMECNEYLKLLNYYFLFHRITDRSEFDFKNKGEYEEYLQLNPPVTMKNEAVKSYGELDIANFLNQNGIIYEYEKPYEMDTRTEEYGQYYPDFYLPEYDIYIEYFGINRQGQVPDYFEASHGKTPTEVYHSSMEWKRKLHEANGTVMIECYAYEKAEGTLLDQLEKKLKEKSVIFTPKTQQEIWQEIEASEKSVLEGIIELFETVINLIKSNHYTLENVKDLNKNDINRDRNQILISLIEPIFYAYEEELKKNGEIDFNDMINLATRYVEQRKYVNPYKYVIVDEYQDISKARYSLLASLRKSSDYNLFCVGDDWQSIYRFAGSDIGFILNFKQYWGSTEISKIETTYRFSDKMIEVSGKFVMENPLQIRKAMRGKQSNIRYVLGEISGYNEVWALNFMMDKLNDLPKDSSVFFIGRYSFDMNILHNSELFYCKYNNAQGIYNVTYSQRMDLKMQFLTAHKSKGLQADYVIILNNKKSQMGFPSKIQNAPILNLLLDDYEQFPKAEERRLFYVALTRAKKKAMLLTINGQESEFVLELRRTFGEELKRERFECPNCGGNLMKRTGPYGDFWGCSNYKSKGCNYTRKLTKSRS